MNEIYEIILSNITQPIWGNWYIKGKYIGKGTFSRVYKIEAERFGRTDISALKIEPVVADDIFFNEEQKKSFIERKKLLVKNESDIMYALRDCANIVRYEDESIKELYIDGNFEGYYFLMRMELLTPVPTLIKDKKMDFSEQNIIKLAKHIGQGIKAAHDKGFIHRDIKPANLFVSDEGIYKLGDFNVSKKNVTARSVTGTDGYIAPEIYRINSDDSYTRQADIYSFGICLYQFMNNFYFPFEEKGKVYTDTAIDKRMRGESFPKPENSSEAFGRIILRACEFDTSKRYKSIDEMLFDLENIDFSRPAESYISTEAPDLYDDNATQYAGEYYPEEDNITSVCEEAESECYTYDESVDTYETEYDDESYSDEFETDLYETNESDFEIEDGVLIKYNGNAEYVKIPYGVTEIRDHAFCGCESLTSVIIPNSVTEIGVWIFQSCENLTSVTIPRSVKRINGFLSDNLSCIEVSENNLNYTSVNGVLFNKDMSKLVEYPSQKINDSYIIPDSVTEIGELAFEQCTNLTSITIPDSVTEIGRAAFEDCENLTSIKIPYGVTELEDSLFWSCKNLTSITIPDSVTKIRDHAFYNCLNLTSVTIPDGVTKIESSTFANCFRLTSVIIPNSVKEIGKEAFWACHRLTSITIPDSVTKIGNKAFWDCCRLTSVIIPNSVTEIGKEAFLFCEKLTSVTIPDSVTKIGENAFSCCQSLTSVTIPRRFENDRGKIFSCSPKVVISYIEEEYRPLTASERKEMKRQKKLDKKFKKMLGKKRFF